MKLSELVAGKTYVNPASGKVFVVVAQRSYMQVLQSMKHSTLPQVEHMRYDLRILVDGAVRDWKNTLDCDTALIEL